MPCLPITCNRHICASTSDRDQFYICSNLRRLEEAGARLVAFSPLSDSLPAGISGLYFGGGYPERHAEALAANRQLRAAVRAFADAGGVIYAECGGMIYLSHSLQSVESLPADMGMQPAGLFVSANYAHVDVRPTVMSRDDGGFCVQSACSASGQI